MILSFYLRVNTSVGVFRLPSVLETLDDCVLDLTFNWVVFEQPVMVYSIRPYAEVCDSEPGFITDLALTNETELQPGDSMYSIDPFECGCFTATVVIIEPDVLKQIEEYITS